MFNPPRSSGVLLHVTSLPSGRLGDDARAFVDWLQAAGQSWWQMLPLGPPDRHGSPYKAKSAFASWPGVLEDPDAPVSSSERDAYREREAFWIEDWMRLAGGRRALDDQIRFDREWSALRAYALERGVRLIGDVPIYVAPQSVDHRAHPELFLRDGQAGAPPDAFTHLGQKWGNPLYDWPALQRRGYRWWVKRFERTFELFDAARIDHFRGLVAYWAVPSGARDARGGVWRRGPGGALFRAVSASLGDLPLIAEDLGVITAPVTRLRESLGLPGMVVIQFAFDPDDPNSPHRPDRHIEQSVVYAGTHDTDTLRGWWATLDQPSRDVARSFGDISDDEPEWGLLEITLGSPARLAMMQAQDVLGLDSSARMNVPGSTGVSWKWRLEPGALTPELAARLRAATEAAGRTL